MPLSIHWTKVPPKVVLLRAVSSGFATIVLIILLSFLSYSIHEMGHVLFGTIGSYLKSGEMPAFTTSAWDNCAGLDFIKCPQQTMWLGGGVLTGAFAFGGVFLVILVASLLSASLYKHTKNRLYLAFPVLYAINEIGGNVICGTDNLMGGPYGICGSLPISFIAGMSILAAACLVFYIVNDEIDARITEKSVKKWFH